MRVHRQQRGQAIAVLALVSVVVFGFAAIGLDQSIGLSDRRDLQAVADSAALAGARSFTSSSANQTANFVAMQYLVKSLKGSLPSSCTSSSNCPAGSYTVGDYTFTLTDNTASETLDVSISHSRRTLIAGVLGFKTAVDGTSARAQQVQSGGPFGFALYSQTVIQYGNQIETAAGDVYVGQNFSNQSSGFSGFCADFVTPGNSSSGGGHLVFGAPQGAAPGVLYPGDGYGPAGKNTWTVPCSTVTTGAKGNLFSSAASGSCPAAYPYSATLKACYANPAISPPQYAQPTITGGLLTGANCTISSANQPAAGVYEVSTTSCPTGVTLDYGTSFTLSCVTLVLDNGVTATVSGKTNGNKWYTYGDSVHGCTGPSSARFNFYAAIGSTVTINVAGPGCCPDYTATGALYAPNGTVTVDKNAAFDVDGQAIVDTWDNQSGNHTGNVVTYDPGQLPNLPAGGGLVR